MANNNFKTYTSKKYFMNKYIYTWVRFSVVTGCKNQRNMQFYIAAVFTVQQ